MMRFVLVGLFSSLFIALAGAQEAVDKEKKNLQGVWIAEAFEESGKKAIGPRARLLDGMSWEFIGDKFIWRMEGHIEIQGTYKIDPGKKPKQIDLADPDRRKAKYVGIYEVEGESLKIRFHEDKEARPKAFTTEKGTRNHFLLILKRSKQ
ncbi:MAG: TIGR03067 domain-containing protein [Gemmataceae bacterium]|nr:TIGR03067 domain-containing protein [Gemmataceae bacterium]MCI0743257.1 TIGR03067 domain-containing protein [Gemmataceae bacterium]